MTFLNWRAVWRNFVVLSAVFILYPAGWINLVEGDYWWSLYDATLFIVLWLYGLSNGMSRWVNGENDSA